MGQNYCKQCGRLINEGENSYVNIVRNHRGKTHSSREDGVLCQECHEEKEIQQGIENEKNEKEYKRNVGVLILFSPFIVAWWIVKHVFLILLFIVSLGNIRK